MEREGRNGATRTPAASLSLLLLRHGINIAAFYQSRCTCVLILHLVASLVLVIYGGTWSSTWRRSAEGLLRSHKCVSPPPRTQGQMLPCAVGCPPELLTFPLAFRDGQYIACHRKGDDSCSVRAPAGTLQRSQSIKHCGFLLCAGACVRGYDLLWFFPLLDLIINARGIAGEALLMLKGLI